MTKPKKIEYIARGVARRGDAILLCRPRDGSYSYLPGGHVEPGEPAAEACAREFAEETGMVVRVGHLLVVVESRFNQSGRPRHEVNFVFHVEHSTALWPTEDTVSLEAAIEFHWAPRMGLESQNFKPAALYRWLTERACDSSDVDWISVCEA